MNIDVNESVAEQLDEIADALRGNGTVYAYTVSSDLGYPTVVSAKVQTVTGTFTVEFDPYTGDLL
jgi:hypothetical protein